MDGADFLKSLPSHFSRSNAAGIPGAAACRASIRFFAAPCAQCQEVSRPEFTLTHSIRSFVRSARRFVRPKAELVLPRFSCRRRRRASFVRRSASPFYSRCTPGPANYSHWNFGVILSYLIKKIRRRIVVKKKKRKHCSEIALK